MKKINPNSMPGWHTVIHPYGWEGGLEIPKKGIVNERMDVYHEGFLIENAAVNRVFRMENESLILTEGPNLNIESKDQSVCWVYESVKETFPNELTDAGLLHWAKWIFAQLTPYQPLFQDASEYLENYSPNQDSIRPFIQIEFEAHKFRHSLLIDEVFTPSGEWIWGIGLTQYIRQNNS